MVDEQGVSVHTANQVCFQTIAGWAQTFGSTGKGQKGSEETEKGYLENPCEKRDF